MTISSVVDIVHGELLNTPSINRIEQIRVNAKKVKRGDLFLSLFGNDIDEALENGAYAVIVPRNRGAADDETAWIGVEDTNQAMLLLLRYLLVQRDIRFIHCDEPLFSLASLFLSKNRNALMLGDSVIKLVETLIDRDEIAYCFSSDRLMLETLGSDVETMTLRDESVAISKASLFQTDLVYEGLQYHFPVASRLAPYLVTLIVFARENGLEMGAGSGGDEGLFHAEYLSRRLRFSPVPTDRVVIVDRPYSKEYIKEGEAFLREHFRWGRVAVFSSSPQEGTTYYGSLQELQSLLVSEPFNYAYVICDDPEGLMALFLEESAREEASLF